MEKKTADFDRLKEVIIDRGLCIGCGTCVGVCPIDAIEMGYETSESEPVPTLRGECTSCGICYEICPGGNIPIPELDKMVFGRKRNVQEYPLGIFKECLRGYAIDDKIRTGASSGGAVSAIVSYALKKGMIDAALLVGWSGKWPWRSEPMIVTAPNEVCRSVRTVPEMSPVNALLGEAIDKRGYKSVGIVGLPCHIHALRKMQLYNKPANLVKHVEFMIGLFCGSTYYFKGIEHFIKELGGISELEDITKMDYRGGARDHLVLTKDGKIRHVGSHHTQTCYFLAPATYKRDRCLMCIDFSSELADLSAGGVFQKVDPADIRKTAILVRTTKGKTLIEGAIKEGYVSVEDHNPELILASGLGWEAKKHANMLRLIERRRYHWPTPNYHSELQIIPRSRKIVFSLLVAKN